MDFIELKKKHRRVFYINLNGINVVFKLPSWKDYKAYTLLLQRGSVPYVYLYDAIFKEIVLDPLLLNHMYQLPAGIVDSVVNVAMYFAGNPLMTDNDLVRVNEEIDTIREAVHNNIYEQFISLICRAFPAYTPHDIEEFDWPEILRLLLLAERILMDERRIQEAINVIPREPEKRTTVIDQIMGDTKKFHQEDNVPKVTRDGRTVEQLTPEQKRREEMIERVLRKREEAATAGI
jgi:hypothetical protein